MVDQKKTDKAAGSEGLDDSDRVRPQGTENTDGNGAGFSGQGGQKEGSTKEAEGTGYSGSKDKGDSGA